MNMTHSDVTLRWQSESCIDRNVLLIHSILAYCLKIPQVNFFSMDNYRKHSLPEHFINPCRYNLIMYINCVAGSPYTYKRI